MNRRGFIALLGGAAAWPLAGHAQQGERMRRVGVLMPFPENNRNAQAYVTAFGQALERLGWVEGKNIRIDHRFAAGDPTLFICGRPPPAKDVEFGFGGVVRCSHMSGPLVRCI